jgi:hypothetical protein
MEECFPVLLLSVMASFHDAIPSLLSSPAQVWTMERDSCVHDLQVFNSETLYLLH